MSLNDILHLEKISPNRTSFGGTKCHICNIKYISQHMLPQQVFDTFLSIITGAVLLFVEIPDSES